MSAASYAVWYQVSHVFSSVMSSIGELFSAGLGLLTSTGLFGKGSFKARDYGGVKKLLRVVGVDQFDAFEFLLVVHDVSFEYAKQKFNTEVRVKAGEHTVSPPKAQMEVFSSPSPSSWSKAQIQCELNSLTSLARGWSPCWTSTSKRIFLLATVTRSI